MRKHLHTAMLDVMLFLAGELEVPATMSCLDRMSSQLAYSESRSAVNASGA